MLLDAQAVVDQGSALGLEMPELTELDAVVRAIRWNSTVSAALGLPVASPSAAPLPAPQATEEVQAAEAASHTVDKTQLPSTSMAQPDALQQPKAASGDSAKAQTESEEVTPEDKAGGPANPSPDPIKRLNFNSQPPTPSGSAAVPQQSLAASGQTDAQLDSTQAAGVATARVVKPAERLTLEEAEGLLEEGKELPVEERLLEQLVQLVDAGQQWEAQVTAWMYMKLMMNFSVLCHKESFFILLYVI